MPKVSVVITCFNLGEFINEAVDSVLTQTFQDFEIIIVNDGSTDETTNNILSEINNPKIEIISTDNQGLAKARNTGIDSARGMYILPLDADDKIGSNYLEEAIRVFDQEEKVGIVYCQAEVFGEENSFWDLPEYDLSKMLIDNLIFCSAFFRKSDWAIVGGYKPIMKYGWEDYDFWLSLIELGKEVYRIPKTLFYYRKRKDSMADSMSLESKFYSYKKIVENHHRLYINNIEILFKKIFLLRTQIEDFHSQQIARDTKIHHLNLKILDLNAELVSLQRKLSGSKSLIRKIFDVAKERLKF